MKSADIKSLHQLSFRELDLIVAKAKALQISQRKQLVKRVREQIDEVLRRNEVSLSELYPVRGSNGGQKKGPLPPKFRHPTDNDLTWSGKARKPGWLQELISQGHSLESLLIGSARQTGER